MCLGLPAGQDGACVAGPAGWAHPVPEPLWAGRDGRLAPFTFERGGGWLGQDGTLHYGSKRRIGLWRLPVVAQAARRSVMDSQ